MEQRSVFRCFISLNFGCTVSFCYSSFCNKLTYWVWIATVGINEQTIISTTAIQFICTYWNSIALECSVVSLDCIAKVTVNCFCCVCTVFKSAAVWSFKLNYRTALIKLAVGNGSVYSSALYPVNTWRIRIFLFCWVAIKVVFCVIVEKIKSFFRYICVFACLYCCLLYTSPSPRDA